MINWKKKPDSTGDWLWIELWSCGCCVMNSGIAWIHNGEKQGKDNIINGFTCTWGKVIPSSYEYIHGWLKIDFQYIIKLDENRYFQQNW